MDNKLTAPLSTLQWVPREWLKPNDYNPNKVSKENLKLLTQSILVNGWTLPIVVRPDYTIIDGFHRWTVSGEEPLKSMLNGKVPIVVVEHSERSEDIYGTVTHNRARGTHLLEPMKAIVKELMGGRENRRRNRKAARYETGRDFPVIRLLERGFSEHDDQGSHGVLKSRICDKNLMLCCYSIYRTKTDGAERRACRSLHIRKKYDRGGDGNAESKKP